MRRVLTLATLAALLAPAPAAARVVAPPGNSEADQYFETLPAAPGPRAPGSPKTPQDAVREGRLSASSARALEGHGEVGQAVAKAAGKTAPFPAGVRPTGPPAEGARVPDKRGLGIVLPLVLALTAAAAAAFALTRRRSIAGR